MPLFQKQSRQDHSGSFPRNSMMMAVLGGLGGLCAVASQGRNERMHFSLRRYGPGVLVVSKEAAEMNGVLKLLS